MIQYYKSAFGFSLVFRLTGSAVYRATLFGVIAVVLLVFMRLWWQDDDGTVENQLIHPYTTSVVLTGTIFLLVFRLQAAYNRYWEATGDIHQMMVSGFHDCPCSTSFRLRSFVSLTNSRVLIVLNQSKFMDSVMHCAAYHMQCHHYDDIKPPSFYDYHELNAYFLTRSREGALHEEHITGENENVRVQNRAKKKSIEQVESDGVRVSRYDGAKRGSVMLVEPRPTSDSQGQPLPAHLEGPAQLDGNWGAQFGPNKATFFDSKHPFKIEPEGFASYKGGLTPSLFLQELAHLASLLNAVALSTLRNDVEGAESPLDIYTPGRPWPAIDPHSGSRFAWASEESGRQWFTTFLGVGRTPEERTEYNAARPLPVLGGVSGAEIHFLQMAR